MFAAATAAVLLIAASAVAEPSGNIYITWSDAAPNDSVPTPHAGYTTATEKCNVCHAVHYAATSGFAWPGGSGSSPDPASAWTADDSDTEMLLRSSVANACNYCHITTSIGGVRLYGGDVRKYTIDSGFAHNGPTAACSGCHSVHGANTFQGANLSKILRVREDRPIQAEVLASTNVAPNANTAIAPLFANLNAARFSADKYLQQVAFCTQCHGMYTDASESTITGGSGYYANPDGIDGNADDYTGEYKGHPLKGAEATFVSPGATFGGTVAFAGSNTCRSCHDAGGTDQIGTTFNSFPHYTQGYYAFATIGGSINSSEAADFDREYAVDGNCLKCHRNGDLSEGVGITY